MNPIIVTVVRNPEMYSRCVSENPFTDGCKLVSFDNREDNQPISRRYNSFIDSLPADTGGWIVFCHEDWQAGEKLTEVLDTLDPSFIYGPIGARVLRWPLSDRIVIKGAVRECGKDGSGLRTVGSHIRSGRVDTLDCQCIIVHSDLIRRHGLRFDENLKFDMYAEDFCVSAFLRAGVVTKVTKITCTHFSKGVISEGFTSSLKYVRQKYPTCPKRFASIVGYKSVFGGKSSRPVHRLRLP